MYNCWYYDILYQKFEMKIANCHCNLFRQWYTYTCLQVCKYTPAKTWQTHYACHSLWASHFVHKAIFLTIITFLKLSQSDKIQSVQIKIHQSSMDRALHSTILFFFWGGGEGEGEFFFYWGGVKKLSYDKLYLLMNEHNQSLLQTYLCFPPLSHNRSAIHMQKRLDFAWFSKGIQCVCEIIYWFHIWNHLLISLNLSGHYLYGSVST